MNKQTLVFVQCDADIALWKTIKLSSECVFDLNLSSKITTIEGDECKRA